MKAPKLEYELVLFMLSIYLCYGQSPTTIGSIATITFSNNGTHTKFSLISSLGGTNSNALSNMWLAVGLNNQAAMNGATDIICQNSATKTIQHYYNNKYNAPTLLNSANPTVGISSASITTNGNKLNCSFTRQNYIPGVANYFNLNTNKSPYLIAAYGSSKNNGGIFLL